MNVENQNILWVKFKNGDNDALSKLYVEYANQLYSYGLKIISDEPFVKDCIQEVFIQLIDKRISIQVTPQIRSYLFKSLRNKLFEELRSKCRKHAILEKYANQDESYEQHAEELLIESEVENNIREKLAKLIAKLSKRQKEIIFLKYTEGFEYDEIADLLQIDISSARTLLCRALKTIKKQLNTNTLILLFLLKSLRL